MKESFILITICLVDLLVTIHLIGAHRAVEGNPVMAFYLQFGLGTFIVMKLLLLALPIFVAEWSRQYRPHFVKAMMRVAILAYVGAYLMLFLSLNVPTMAAETPGPHTTHAVHHTAR
jgi:hypothetical protein